MFLSTHFCNYWDVTFLRYFKFENLPLTYLDRMCKTQNITDSDNVILKKKHKNHWQLHFVPEESHYFCHWSVNLSYFHIDIEFE